MSRIGFLLLIPMLLANVWTPGESQADDLDRLFSAAEEASRRGDSAKAVQLLSRVIQQSPDSASAYYLRGRENFRQRKVKKSVADFDKYVKLRPEGEPRLWERGIAYYYQGEFKKGARQFEMYQQFDGNDVENSVWRYLCMAQSLGIQKAQVSMLPIRDDRRVPMMQIFDLYRGVATPEDVLQAVKADKPSPQALKKRLFYAHLYLGLYYEAMGKKKLATEHIRLAAHDYPIDHYMADVARLHAARLKEVKTQQ